ncbi:glutamine ABC transporter periplasmic protein [compost metagenome]
MDFSDPYIVNSQAVLMRVEDQDITLDRFKDAGRKLSAQANTTDAQVAESVVGKENVAAYDTFSAAIIALKNKDVDGVVINGANAAAYEREFAGELVVAIKDLESDPLGLVFRKGDENVAAFNEGLKMIKDDGTLDQLISKYWGLK